MPVEAEILVQKAAFIFAKKYRNQFLGAFTAQLLTFAHGIATGWLAPTLQQLQSPDSPLDFGISVEEASWIGSLFGLGAFAGNVIYGLLLNRIGRKWSMYSLAVPNVLMWVLIYLTQSPVYLYVARFLGGVTGGGNYLVVPIFVSEISDPAIRGALSSMLMLFVSFGMLVGYVLSAYLDYFLIPCILVLFPVVYLLGISQFPDTPHYLLRNQKVQEAEESFKFYKRLPAGGTCAEFEDLRAAIQKGGHTEPLTFKDVANRDALKAFLTAFVLMVLNQFSGIFAILNYMSDVFALSGTSIPPNTCTILMGVVQILGMSCAIVLVDRFGRKVLILTSAGGLTLGLFSCGAWSRFAPEPVRLQYNWMPLVLYTFVIFIGCIGVVALILTIIVEILPAKIRHVGVSLCMATLSIMVFAVLKLFPVLLYSIGLDLTMFCCGSVSLSAWLYLLIFLKETKGKSLDH